MRNLSDSIEEYTKTAATEWPKEWGEWDADMFAAECRFFIDALMAGFAPPTCSEAGDWPKIRFEAYRAAMIIWRSSIAAAIPQASRPGQAAAVTDVEAGIDQAASAIMDGYDDDRLH